MLGKASRDLLNKPHFAHPCQPLHNRAILISDILQFGIRADLDRNRRFLFHADLLAKRTNLDNEVLQKCHLADDAASRSGISHEVLGIASSAIDFAGGFPS